MSRCRGARSWDALWSDGVPASATKTLHSLLAREPGYVLNTSLDTVDVARFEVLLARARQSDDPVTSARLLREALALWTGDPLADCRPGEWTRQESARLVELRMDATEHLMDSSLALGEHAAATPLVNSLVEQHPFRERLWEQLMIALHRCGRQAEALAAFHRARSVLRSASGDDQFASVHPRWELDPFSCEVAPAAAISLRRADPRPYLADEVPDSALTWLLHAARAENCDLELVARHNGVLLRMIGHDWLRLGEAVSAVLLASTVWGLASQAVLHEGEVLVRVGWQSPNAEPLPQSAR